MTVLWSYTPSCPCRRCEKERADKGMTINCWPFGLSEENDATHYEFGAELDSNKAADELTKLTEELGLYPWQERRP